MSIKRRYIEVVRNKYHGLVFHLVVLLLGFLIPISGGQVYGVTPLDLSEEEFNRLTDEISSCNEKAIKEMQGKAENPGVIGVIKGYVKVTSRRDSSDTVVYLENVNNNHYKPVQKAQIPEDERTVSTKKTGAHVECPVMDQLSREFVPHVLPILKGMVVDFPNSDVVRHNVYSIAVLPGTKRKLSLGTYSPGIIKTARFDTPGAVHLRCNVHTEMSAYIVVLENPYFTVTDKHGAFTIENVPAGKYTLKTWHESFEPVSVEVSVQPGQTVEVKLPDIDKKRKTTSLTD